MKNIILTFLSLTLLNSCNKEIKPQKGAIDVISNIYVDASKALDNTQSYYQRDKFYKRYRILFIRRTSSNKNNFGSGNCPKATLGVFYERYRSCFYQRQNS